VTAGSSLIAYEGRTVIVKSLLSSTRNDNERQRLLWLSQVWFNCMQQGKLSILTSVIKNACDSSSGVACQQDVMVFLFVG